MTKYGSLILDRLVSLHGQGFVSPLTIFFLVALVPLVILHKISSKRWKKEDAQKRFRGLEAIPCAKPLFPIKFIGNFPLLLPLTETLNNFEKLSKEHGDIFKFIGVNQTFVFLLSGPLVQSLLKSTDDGHLIKEPIVYESMKPHLNDNGILVSQGAFWKGQRKILGRTLSFSSLKTYMGLFNRRSKGLVKEFQILFEDGATHQISSLIHITFLKIIGEIITGYEIESAAAEFAEYHSNFEIWRECVMKRIVNPLLFFNPLWNLHPLSRKNGRAVEAMSAFAKRRIGEHRERRACSVVGERSSKSLPSIRSYLDELIDEGVDDSQLVEEINGIMFGGHGTGASTIQFFCFVMAHNPEIQQACQQEVDQLFQDHHQNQDLLFESVQSELKYLERCILETLRLFPPIFMFFRRLSTPLDIERPEGRIRLPSGTSVVVAPYLIHRKEHYFPDSYKFDPDRFLPEEQAKRHTYAYIPFSAGNRNCLGFKFAMLEIKIVAAHILRNFDISSTDKMWDIPLLPSTTLAPQRDYTFSLKRRLAK